MGKILAIQGHGTRGKEVIELLEMLGGERGDGGAKGFDESAIYVIPVSGIIDVRLTYKNRIDNYAIFTLEEFLKKYPFKVGDKVFLYDNITEGCVTGMKWDEDKEDIKYCVYTSTFCWCDVKELMEYNAEFLLNKEKGDKNMFKKHDIVVCETGDKHNKWICEYKSHTPELLKYYKGTYVISRNDPIREDLLYDSRYDISPTDIIRLATPSETTLFERLIDKCFNNECIDDNPIAECKKFGQSSYALKIADGYKFFGIDENGDIIVQSIKPLYPMTYKECCKVIKKNPDITPEVRMVSPEESLLFSKLIMLKRCRDAYWKIAGKEMGLGEPWSPDWNDLNRKYFISLTCDGIGLYDDFRNPQILAFPTETMRDAFYENFKDLIENCKELL